MQLEDLLALLPHGETVDLDWKRTFPPGYFDKSDRSRYDSARAEVVKDVASMGSTSVDDSDIEAFESPHCVVFPRASTVLISRVFCAGSPVPVLPSPANDFNADSSSAHVLPIGRSPNSRRLFHFPK